MRIAKTQKMLFNTSILQLWKSFATFRGESEISTWIYRVSLNTILTKKGDKKSISIEPLDTPHQDFCIANELVWSLLGFRNPWL